MTLLDVQCDREPDTGKPFAYQYRPELELLCDWIEKQAIRSYLEIGFYRGGLMSALHARFAFDVVAGCDEGIVQERRRLKVEIPKDARVCWATSTSPTYWKFRADLGKVDLVFIDGDHTYGAVRQDFLRERRQRHRFLAFHDIRNTSMCPGVVKLWNDMGGKKRELYVPRTDGGEDMGIGLWSESEAP